MVRPFVLAAVLLVAGGAHGDEAADKAVGLAQQLYEQHEWEAARKQLVKAYELAPAPDLLFHIALTYQAEGSYRQARIYLDRFLTEIPADDPRRAEVERLAGTFANLAVGDATLPPETAQPPARLDIHRKLDPDALLDPSETLPMASGAGGGGDDGDRLRPGGTARTLFWASTALTTAGLLGFLVAGSKVHDYEDAKDQAIVDSWSDPDGGIRNASDACAAAGQHASSAALRVSQACDSGKNWATAANVFAFTSVVTGIASGYFLYKGYIAAPTKRVAVNPSAGPGLFKLELELSF